jgi:hypothetical protein
VSARASIMVLALGCLLASPVFASDVGYIYGRVKTTGGDVYEGQLRWGKEEAFWDDIFNATKAENENLKYVDRKDLKRIRSNKSNAWNLLGIGDHDWDFTHLFAVRFGDLKRIEVRGGDDDLVVEFRNGEELQLGGGSNDVGAKITVVDARRGRRELKWNRIETIEFLNTPASLPDKLGEPIYGTVVSGQREFTGRIQWDNDETLTTDELDGDTRDEDVSVEFGEIASIRKHRNGSLVRLKSGDELYLTGSNDVNDGNRGVVVVVPGVGTVKVGWDDFDELKLVAAPNSGRSYADYARGSDLSGEVVTEDGSFSGRIVFDLDESRDFEMLHGTNGDTEFLIPFREIARIRPLGKRRSDVELRMGLTIELEESQDVTRKNDGLLVFTGNRKPRYVAWQDVSDVRLAESPR